MTDVPDARLLEQFARNGSEEAFAALVQRHIALVHSVALRHTANAQHAQDITQAVFVILARKAGTLGRRTVLPGWLYHTARLTAANLQRAETSRVRREQEAFMQSQLEESVNDALWRELSPQLDEAMAGLGTGERDALVLRYFQNQSMAEVGKFLGLEENTAQKRVSRALEKLRTFFTKRGVSSTTAIIAGVISANSVQAVPVALAKSVTAVAIAKGAAASIPTLALAKTTVIALTMKTKIIVATAIIGTLILGAGVGSVYVIWHHKMARVTFASKPPLTFANSAFKQDGDKDGFFTVDLDTNMLRTSTSAPAIHIKGPIGAAASGTLLNNNRAFENSDNSASTLCVVGPGSPLLGQHICVTGWLKTSNVQHWASAFLLIATREARSKGWSRVDSMSDRPILFTTDWQQVKFVTDVPNQPCVIYFGPDLYGPGELWGDDFHISLADPEDPITDDRAWRQSFTSAHDYPMTTDLANTHDGNPSICFAYTGPANASARSFAWFGHTIHYPESERYAGHTVRLSGWIKTENVSNHVQPQIRPLSGLMQRDSKLLAKDSMVQDKSIRGTLNWTPFSLTCDIPKNTGYIVTSFIFWGSGKVWIDTNSLELTIVK
jgi:RNA polymerase sigma factor (sigma-70 family)